MFSWPSKYSSLVFKDVAHVKFENRENTFLLSTFILQVDLILDREGNEGLDRDVGTYVHE